MSLTSRVASIALLTVAAALAPASAPPASSPAPSPASLGPALVDLVKVLDAPSATLCGGTYDRALARVKIEQFEGRTSLRLRITDAMPNAGYTMWVKLDGTSPITGLPFTPAANTSDLAGLVPITPDADLLTDALGTGDDGTGGDVAVNGFYTDANGDAEFSVLLDFPVIKGAFQFQEVVDAPRGATGDDPFILAIVSHCTDAKFHGLVAGVNEMWWQLQSNPFED